MFNSKNKYKLLKTSRKTLVNNSNKITKTSNKICIISWDRYCGNLYVLTLVK